ncbi:SDR family oxidoreductase [Acidithiobacillus caldus]|nr:SDR family oxidoreductase [Acidithiobacillus caldus]MBU2734456.1 SDR family oxidoreductase [Acidithiobacillus caldus ATCC 51756]MBU2729034.1 SDR family oxidoreductase [Acidithiobacillus caldus]MBU2744748.1 SDR family oxidoreductase [Acidithiobacillus caldus]MBU2779252.1 SDR family oxidoreductase [Acidithiobacillus caldus]
MGYKSWTSVAHGFLLSEDAKCILVTGAARRVGAEIARHLASAGCDIALHYRHSQDDAESLAHELRALGRRVQLLQGDLLEPDYPRQLVRQTMAAFGRLDGIVHNASLYRPKAFAEVDLRHWQEMEGIHLHAPFFLAQAAAAELRLRRGAIVHITDIYAERPLLGYLPYSVSKAALVSLTRALAKELGPEIRVNSVAPGVVLWAETQQPAEGSRAVILDRTALKRAGNPADIARAVRFLLLEADYVSGQNVVVDGGRMIY